MAISDAERSGRPVKASTPENVAKIHKIILNNHKMKIWELPDTIKISNDTVWKIIHEKLKMKKLVMWVPRSLTIDQKQQRLEDSQKCLKLFQLNPNKFLRWYVTVDKTWWIHFYTPELTQQSKQ